MLSSDVVAPCWWQMKTALTLLWSTPSQHTSELGEDGSLSLILASVGQTLTVLIVARLGVVCQ